MSPTPRRIAAVVAVLAAGAAATAATAATHATTRHLTADPHGQLRFTTTRLVVHPGKVTILMHDPSSSGLAHGIAVEGHGVDKDGKIVKAGGTSRVTVTLRKGTYEFYCPIAAHKKAGMKGKIIVR